MNTSRNYNHSSILFENNHSIYEQSEMNGSFSITNEPSWQCDLDYSNISISDDISKCNKDFQSPEKHNADFLLTSFMRLINCDSLDSFNDEKFCKQGTSINNRCRECTRTPCDDCKISHQSAQRSLVRRQSISALEQQNAQNIQNKLNRSSPICTYNGPSTTPLHHCDVHREDQLVYCQTCNQSLCGGCNSMHHRGHVTVRLMEVVEMAGLQAQQAMAEAREGIHYLRDDLETVQLAVESLDHRARLAATDVMVCIRRVASALEDRERELLAKIEKARVLKFAALKAKDEILRNCITRLTNAANKLGKAMEISTQADSPLDLLMSTDKMSAEVFQIRQSRQNLPTSEDSYISFSGPDSNALNAIANLGNVVVNNLGPVGDRRPVRGRGNSPYSFFGQQSLTPLINSLPIPRGRPISDCDTSVIVRISPSTRKGHKIIGNDGDLTDRLCRPWGLACDKDGNIIIADRSNNRIQIFRKDGSLIRRFGTHGNGPCQFDRPAGITVDCRRRIIVADKDNHRIQILTMEGSYLMSFGEKGCQNGQFNYPWDVAVNMACQIVVSDTRNHRVQLFSPEGVFMRKYGYESMPSMWRHFDSPRGVAFDPNGNVVTTDFNNHRLVVISADFLHARVLTCETGTTPKQFLRPQGIIVDDDGNILIADSRNHQIQVFDSVGAFKWRFGTGTQGNTLEQLDRPSGIALTPDGGLAIVDFGNNRVLLV